jgi:hypothetical protein
VKAIADTANNNNLGLRMKLLTPALLAGMALVVAGSAHAYATFFGEDSNSSSSVPLKLTPNSDNAQTAFLTGVTSLGTETFETQTVGTVAPLTLTFPGAGQGKLSATLVGGNGSVASVTPGDTNGFGRYSIPSATSSRYWEVAAGPAGNFMVTFGRKIAAFGFYGVDIGDFGGQLQLQLLNGSDQVGLLTVPNTIGSNGSTDGSVLYYGFVAKDAGEFFDSARFLTTTGIPDGFAFDNFTIADLKQVVPVPEPGSLALVAGALLALGSTRLRAS